eukprot:CAMPEP_0113678640 /NCGR_PEP_ID=MMETSP0038_2-20120614/10089_1 /TAXON_ID=2898 /ORGANISM="Cryptomonas paramecium" /LENGTH=69 /DNA_ID=CAMNT_0000596359 /DNA_START=27 /DNA_END=233 /DNA_ORIENTATION=- /assembly_acc=CAM_ASM_000170
MANCFGLDAAVPAHRYRLLRILATAEPIALAFWFDIPLSQADLLQSSAKEGNLRLTAPPSCPLPPIAPQ